MAEFFPAREIDTVAGPELDYSFCSLVTDGAQYRDMVASFVEAGFAPDRCEFLFADNRNGNKADGYRGLNRLIAASRGRYVVLVHQDVLAMDPAAKLDANLARLTETAPEWAVAGNAGYAADGKTRLTPVSTPWTFGTKPATDAAPVAVLDDCFLILRRDAVLGLSEDIEGFQLSGVDLVTQALLRGRSAWVVDFALEHFGAGTLGEAYLRNLETLEAKYMRAFAGRVVRTVQGPVGVGKQNVASGRFKAKLRRAIYGGWQKAVSLRVRKLKATLNRLSVRDPMHVMDQLEFHLPKTAPRAVKAALRKGTYEEHERKLMARWVPVDLPVVELGGSYGVISTLLRRRLAVEQKLVVVEANPDLMPVCRGNVARLAPKGETVFVNKALAYGDTLTVPFMVTSGIHTSHVAEEGQEGVVMVPATSLETLLAEQGIGGPYVLVCDIEGHEFDLLQNEPETLRRCAMMLVEIHPPVFYEQGRSVRDFMKMLAAAGFEVVESSGTVLAARRV